jgi:hypothetical protein
MKGDDLRAGLISREEDVKALKIELRHVNSRQISAEDHKTHHYEGMSMGCGRGRRNWRNKRQRAINDAVPSTRGKSEG